MEFSELESKLIKNCKKILTECIYGINDSFDSINIDCEDAKVYLEKKGELINTLISCEYGTNSYFLNPKDISISHGIFESKPSEYAISLNGVIPGIIKSISGTINNVEELCKTKEMLKTTYILENPLNAIIQGDSKYKISGNKKNYFLQKWDEKKGKFTKKQKLNSISFSLEKEIKSKKESCVISLSSYSGFSSKITIFDANFLLAKNCLVNN